MKKRFLVLISSAIVLILALGIGTYAWFNARVSINDNKFETGTLELDGSEDKTIELMNLTNAAPGSYKDVNFTITNTGTLDMLVKVELSQNLTKKEGTAGKLPNGDEFKIKTIKFNIGDTPWGGDPEMTAKDFVSYVNSKVKDIKLRPEETIEFEGTVKLDENAGNDYQGVTLTVGGTIYGKQDTEGSQY